MAYLIAFFLSLLFSFCVPQTQNEDENSLQEYWWSKAPHVSTESVKKFVWGGVSLLAPLLVACFRYGVGTDYFYTYVPRFREIALGLGSYYEKGFYYLNKIIACFTDNAQWLIAIVAILTLGILYIEIFRHARNYQISIVLLFLTFTYFITLNNIRQSLASAILMIAVSQLIKNRKIVFTCLVVLATTIHRVSIIYLVLLLSIMNISALTYLIMSGVVFVAAKFIAPRLMVVLAQYIPRLAQYLTDPDLQIYSGRSLSYLFILLQICIMMIYVYLEHDRRLYTGEQLTDEEQLEWKIAKMSQFLLLAICSLDGLVPATYRIMRLFSYLQFLQVPNVIIMLEPNKKSRRVLLLVVIMIFFVIFCMFLRDGLEQVFPYRSIFTVEDLRVLHVNYK